MKEYICDKCNRKIEGNTYYTIDIYGHDINPTNDNRVAFDTATQNAVTNMQKIFEQQKCYCKDCKEDIERYIGR